VAREVMAIMLGNKTALSIKKFLESPKDPLETEMYCGLQKSCRF
jgi:hypothetical protein